MLVLDTDVQSLTENAGPDAASLQTRLGADGRPQTITIMSVQERLRGRIAVCQRATDPDAYVRAARLLHRTFVVLQKLTILDFDDRAANQFRSLKAQRIRIGTMDLRIASIVLAHGGLLISRNLKDFRKVPNLRVEDWTR